MNRITTVAFVLYYYTRPSYYQHRYKKHFNLSTTLNNNLLKLHLRTLRTFQNNTAMLLVYISPVVVLPKMRPGTDEPIITISQIENFENFENSENFSKSQVARPHNGVKIFFRFFSTQNDSIRKKKWKFCYFFENFGPPRTLETPWGGRWTPKDPLNLLNVKVLITY